MNQEDINQSEDLQTKLDDISKKLEIITLTTSFVSNILIIYITSHGYSDKHPKKVTIFLENGYLS